MKRALKFQTTVAVIALALAGSAAAETVLFDPDGPGPDAAVQVQMWDFAPGNVLARDGVTAASAGVGAPFTAYGHAQLQALFFNGLPVSQSATFRLNLDYEITQVTGFGEKVDAVVDLNANGNPDFSTFRLNPDPAVANFF